MPVQSCVVNGRPGYKWGNAGKCYTYSPNNESTRKAAKRKAYLQGATMDESVTDFVEAASDKPWSGVQKSKLPKSAFLWIEGDGKLKSQWHLPYRDEKGNVNLNALRAIAAAIAGARTGKPMSIPAEVRKKIDELLKKYKIGKYAVAKKSEPEVDGVIFFEKEIERVVNLFDKGIVLECNLIDGSILKALSKGRWG